MPAAKRIPVLIAGVTAAVTLFALADFLEDRLESRADTPDPSRVTMIEVEFDSHGHQPNGRDAQQLWLICSEGLTPAQRSIEPRVLGPGRMEVAVHPALGEGKQRRVRGCLNDLSVEWVRTTAVRLREEPAGAR